MPLPNRSCPCHLFYQIEQTRYWLRLLCFVTILLPMVPHVFAEATNSASQTAGLFDESVLADNVFWVRSQARSLSIEDRYDRLQEWVLPSYRPNVIRLFGKLTPSEPVPPIAEDHPFDAARLRAAAELGQRRVATGGNLVSPVFDLIESARELSRLDELRAIVRARPVQSEVAQRGQLCLLALIEMARGDDVAAASAADQLFARLSTGAMPQLIDRMPETLFAWAVAEQGRLLVEAERVLVPIWENQILKGTNAGPGEWDRMIPILLGRVRHAKQYGHSKQPFNIRPPLKTWHTATRKHAWSRSQGVPACHWQWADGQMICLARQDDEFLLFGTPLRGNFTVECSCSGFGYRDCHPFVAGSWVDPVYTLERVTMGGLFSWRPDVAMNPKLSYVEDFVQYRVEVRNGVCSRYINGRLIHSETLPPDHDPWVSIRVPHYGFGHVRDVRITGTPTIPEEVILSELKSAAYAQPIPAGLTHHPINQLHGWMPWHDELWDAQLQLWHAESDESGRTVIVGRRAPEVAGAGGERLLRYHWPLVWDSEVTYEFLYRPGESIAHPAIGKRSFLLEPDGLKRHWISNGYMDRSGLDPQNSSPIPKSHSPLPLKPGTWNTVALRLKGDAVELSLNGVAIGTDEVEPTNDRTLGIFYDCGETEARVRNVTLRGDWPKEVPPIEKQELRGTQADEYDIARDALPAKFDFDFTRTTAAEFESQFRLSSTDNPKGVELLPQGLRMTAISPVGKYKAATIGLKMTIEGDFDITTRYEDLELTMPERGYSGIYQCHLFSQPTPRHYNLIRSNGQYKGIPQRNVIQAEIFDLTPQRGGATYPAIMTDESPAGRMRMVRRGQTLTYMAAPFDSESFRVLHALEVNDEPLDYNEFHLRTSAYSEAGTESKVSVIWKDLRVRAEKLTNHNLIGRPLPKTLPPAKGSFDNRGAR